VVLQFESKTQLMLGARTSRPHRAGAAKSSQCPDQFVAISLFALRAQCGRDVRAPSEKKFLI